SDAWRWWRRLPRWRRRRPWRRRAALRSRAETRHRPARPSRQRPRLLPLQLSRQYQGLCRRDCAGSAGRDAGSRDARSRPLSPLLLRQAWHQVPQLPRLARRWRADPVASEDTMMTLLRPMAIDRRLGVIALAGWCLFTPAAQAQQSFPNPDDAASALAAAAKSGVKQDMLKVLGDDGEDIVDSGDDVADADARSKFVSAYDAKHS